MLIDLCKGKIFIVSVCNSREKNNYGAIWNTTLKTNS